MVQKQSRCCFWSDDLGEILTEEFFAQEVRKIGSDVLLGKAVEGIFPMQSSVGIVQGDI